MCFVSRCDNDITQSRSSLWGLKKMKMIKQVLKNIKGTTRKWREKKNRKKKCAAEWNRTCIARSPGKQLTSRLQRPM